MTPAAVPAPPADADGTSLADLAHTQWQLGDWAGLAALDEALVRADAARIRLALFVAVAHQQLGQWAESQRFASLARAWGCSDARLARWLLGGAHNTLGRAAAALGRPEQAVGHFRESLALVAAPALTQLALPLRIGAQYAQLDLSVPAAIEPALRPAGSAAQAGALAHAAESQLGAADRLQRQHDESMTLQAALRAELADWRKAIEATVRREAANGTRQLQAHADLQRYLDGGSLLPALHGWAISADFARELLALFDAGAYDLVVEFGSGTSTVLLALAIQRGRRLGRERLPALLTFEHQTDYHQQTLRQLESAGASGIADLVLAPLQPYRTANERTYPYYACQAALGEAAGRLAGPSPSLLVVVDGPPAATGRHARFPAVPLLLEHFPDARFDLLLDDYRRRDEQQVVSKWQVEFEARGFEVAATELELEKQACLLRAWKPAFRPAPPDGA